MLLELFFCIEDVQILTSIIVGALKHYVVGPRSSSLLDTVSVNLLYSIFHKMADSKMQAPIAVSHQLPNACGYVEVTNLDDPIVRSLRKLDGGTLGIVQAC